MIDLFREKLVEWVARSHTWKSKGGYPNLTPEEIAGRAAFLKAVKPPFLPWPTNPPHALATYDALKAIAQI